MDQLKAKVKENIFICIYKQERYARLVWKKLDVNPIPPPPIFIYCLRMFIVTNWSPIKACTCTHTLKCKLSNSKTRWGRGPPRSLICLNMYAITTPKGQFNIIFHVDPPSPIKVFKIVSPSDFIRGRKNNILQREIGSLGEWSTQLTAKFQVTSSISSTSTNFKLDKVRNGVHSASWG